MNRKARGLNQKLFLIESIDNDVMKRQYVIMGSTGNVYTVSITNTPSCTCPDHQQRKNICKHIYFVMLKIMRVPDGKEKNNYTDEELMDMFKNIPATTTTLYVDDKTRQKYNKEKNKVIGTSQKDKDEDVCPVCLDDIGNGEELDYCKYSCGKNIHSECFKMWTKQNKQVCVFCRGDWNVDNDGYINLSI